MDETSEYSTRDFSFKKGALFIYRNRVVEEVRYDQIKGVTIKKGTTLKRPEITIVIGVLLLLYNYYLLSSVGFDLYLYFDTGLFFLAGIGGYMIYAGAPTHPIIEIALESEIERYSISSLIKSGKLETFTSYLEKELGALKVVVKDIA